MRRSTGGKRAKADRGGASSTSKRQKRRGRQFGPGSPPSRAILPSTTGWLGRCGCCGRVPTLTLSFKINASGPLTLRASHRGSTRPAPASLSWCRSALLCSWHRKQVRSKKSKVSGTFLLTYKQVQDVAGRGWRPRAVHCVGLRRIPSSPRLRGGT